MKKLLVLALVLGLASIGNAVTVGLTASQTDVHAGDVVTISISTDAAGAGKNGWVYLEMALPSIGVVSNVVPVAAAGNMATVTDYSSASLLDLELNAADSSGAGLLAGVKFTGVVTISAAAKAGQMVDIWVTAFNNEQYPVDKMITLTVIPEPITMTLLGLGGLLLRKKK